MKMKIELWYGEDHMQCDIVSVRSVKDGLDRVLPWLDKTRDPINGRKSWDWSEINVKFTQ